MQREKIFSFSISTGSYADFISEILRLPDDHYSSYVCFANVHMTIEAYNDSAFNDVISNANIVAPDGKPLSIFLRLMKGIRQERVAGMDIFPDILREATNQNKSIFLYGSTKEVLEKITTKASLEFPALEIRGAYSPPFRELTPNERKDVIKRLKDANADLIFVSLGCPKQENWMAHHRGLIRGCMLGLGQAFNIYAGIERRSPYWMQKYALEWLFRLLNEPVRLGQRYFITNSQFLILSIKYLLKKNFTA